MTTAEPRSVTNGTIRSITSHRSIRHYLPTPVDEATVDAIIASAQSAPTSSHKQAYSVVRVTDPDARRRLAVVADDQEWVELAPLFLVWCADLYRVRAAVAAAGEPVAYDNIEEFMVAVIDTSLAAAHAYVAAQSLGLGGVMIGGLRDDPVAVTEILGLPELVAPLYGMCLGYPDEDPELKPRLPRDLVLHEGRYDRAAIHAGIAGYDRTVERYYLERSESRRETTWTGEMIRKFAEPQRPHMRDYLDGQGFGFD